MLRHFLAIAAGLLLAAGSANAGFYCWTNKDGNKECGDAIPPEYSKQDREVRNSKGQEVNVLPHEKTEAELAEDARQEKLKRLAEQDAANDRALLQTYASVADIERVRDERLAMVDGNIKLSQTSAGSSQKKLEELRTRKADAEKAGEKTPGYVTKQIAEFEARVSSAQKAVVLQQEQRQSVSAKFERDIARYRQLKGLSGSAEASAAPSPANQAANPGVGK